MPTWRGELHMQTSAFLKRQQRTSKQLSVCLQLRSETVLSPEMVMLDLLLPLFFYAQMQACR